MGKRGSRAAGGLVIALSLSFVPVTPATAAFSDVPSGYWAGTAIRNVAETHNWMRDSSGDRFSPESGYRRKHFARALVRAFSPEPPGSPDLQFSDLPSSSSLYPFANTVTKLGWMRRSGEAFRPDDVVNKTEMYRALVLALGLHDEVRGLDRIGTPDGYRFRHPSHFAYLALGEELRLSFNHRGSEERRSLNPRSPVRRADGAYALHQAKSAEGTWRVSSLAPYASITLPNMSASRKKIVEFAFRWVGWPYVYAGEWHTATPAGYCCGAQAVGGFDCSGWVWWVMRAPGGGYDNTKIRGYSGYKLPERSSAAMAREAPQRIAWSKVLAFDLLFYDTDDSGSGYSSVDHVGLSLGNGWMIHSSGGRGGVVLGRAADDWWVDHFVWGRRLTR